ncbi:hypothetical protein LEP1GSC132_2188 [Leptospira kirschneri str. 200803703]|uniref:Uncharacterized protein n=1 Tax=Leptospira kirschneri str. 200802841 TaxID=1193047 RepID=A0A828Y2A7_9LEPT|nr:hypothetical protein LEP1GSC044_0873 [Leptospira kirschneri serovar Grippotyphosa str. RM52]EKO51901.1 hypothetical protein LEP1GSC131_1243 [Leptospira kirschneri str. 200802841]EKP03996.1 hypothetical protein LEP1GSC018_4149 [Leptospira kirschneri str. 2008720114]EKQ83151.1 hypothetical protein LEP1GSC064_1310 [Leptospira kirschneri serovar Grippotyphosa str. Moskva]EKR07872.1 hypothetical protein LEP1GSC122_2106 [Leptospira kirschneri serovar Valbuzzi str. 200702274]EMK00219.1 hypothetica
MDGSALRENFSFLLWELPQNSIFKIVKCNSKFPFKTIRRIHTLKNDL